MRMISYGIPIVVLHNIDIKDNNFIQAIDNNN
jgi:hypothetical protein